MILMPLLSPESVTSLPSPRTWSSSSSSSNADSPVSPVPLEPSLPMPMSDVAIAEVTRRGREFEIAHYALLARRGRFLARGGSLCSRLRFGNVLRRQDAARFGFEVHFQLFQSFKIARRAWQVEAEIVVAARLEVRIHSPALRRLLDPHAFVQRRHVEIGIQVEIGLADDRARRPARRVAKLGFAEQNRIGVNIDRVILVERKRIVGSVVDALRLWARQLLLGLDRSPDRPPFPHPSRLRSELSRCRHFRRWWRFVDFAHRLFVGQTELRLVAAAGDFERPASMASRRRLAVELVLARRRG